MRRVVLVGLVLLVCVSVAGCTGGGGIGSGGGTLPTAEVSAVFDQIEQAVIAEDVEALVWNFAYESTAVDLYGNSLTVSREVLKEGWEYLFAVSNFPVYQIIDRQIVFHGSIEATVTATVNMTVYMFGEWNSSTSVYRWALRRVDGRWLIYKEEQLA